MFSFAVLILLVPGTLSRHPGLHLGTDSLFDNNFQTVDYLSDGQNEKRIVWDGIAAKETSVKKEQTREELKLWQVTDGSILLHLIYLDDQLQDCDYVTDQESIFDFIEEFKNDERKLEFVNLNPELDEDIRNVSRTVLDDRPHEQILNIHALKKQCKDRHEIKNTRTKRSTSSNIFRMPNTEWCGQGYGAEKYKDVGGYVGTDRCCRDHDLRCAYFIEAWQTKYGLTNWMFYTLNHCNCDEIFRSCLKRTNTAASHLVGKIFFNIARTKCFVFEPEKVCMRSSWWGQCQKWIYKKMPKLRDPLSY